MSTIGDYINAKRDTKQAAGGTWWSEPEAYLAEALKRRGIPFEQQVRGAEAAAEARAKFCPDRLSALARLRAERAKEAAA